MVASLIAGNWKMNGLLADLDEAKAVAKAAPAPVEGVELLLCPPFTLIGAMANVAGSSALKTGAQFCHTGVSGAHTGDVSAQMLKDAGATHVIVGHSERRSDHGESDGNVAAQATAVLSAGLIPIVCVGETLAQREAGETLALINGQLAGSIPDAVKGSKFVVAYEPVWAIGTGKVAGPTQIAEVHTAIRNTLAARFGEQGVQTQILYGGSMKPGNAEEILQIPNVNGGLIGGASLKATDFLGIYEIAKSLKA